MNRCSANDIAFLQGFGAVFGGASNCPVGLSSDMIHSLIAVAELYDARRPRSELEAQAAIQYVAGSDATLGMWDLVRAFLTSLLSVSIHSLM